MKRIFDIFFSLSVLLALMPILIILSVIIKLESAGPIFFLQERLGYRGKSFDLFKFRSMSNIVRNSACQTYGDESDVTRVGKVIRRFKVDELPQLINVLIGDMSIVGPRPCLVDLKESFNQDGWKRIEVRPGLTGLAQISGNIYLSWEERWKLDRIYVEQRTMWLDLKIIAKSVMIVLFGDKRGLSQ